MLLKLTRSKLAVFTSPALATLLLALLLPATISANTTEIEALTPTKGQSQTAREIVYRLTHDHYRDMPMDDEVSSRYLDSYLDTLDPSKTFFFKSDIEEFNKHRDRFDDYFSEGELDVPFMIFNRYRQRVSIRLEAIIARLQNEDLSFDFTRDEQLLVDPEQAEWAVDQATANRLWHKRLKSNLLNLMLTDKTLDEAKETLLKRYEMELNRWSQFNSDEVFETAINALTLLYDPHTNYLSPQTLENFNINMSLQLQGIGAVLRTKDEYTQVDRVVTGGPADKQGDLKRADRIIAVGQGAKGAMEDVIGWRLDDVVKKIRGERNTVVRLDVLTPENQKKTIQITRDTVKLEDQAAKSGVFEFSDGEDLYKIGVIDIPNFYHDFEAYRRRDPNYRSTTRDVKRLLGELEQAGVDGIILDIRNNGGGSLQEAEMLTDLFIDPGPVVQIRQSNQRISRHSQSRSQASYRGPMVVLINRLSASASEIFAGAIQDYQRGLIVGNRSFGKGTVQSLKGLSEGQIKITESKFYRVSGDSTQHRGVVPDIQYPDLIDTEKVGESSYDHALPWDQIHEDPHATYYDLAEMFPYLQELHEKRATRDPDFVYLTDQQEIFAAQSDRNYVSLNEKTRRAEQKELEQKGLAIENKRRIAKGLEPYKTLEAYREAEDTEEDETASLSDPQEINPKKDAVLNETGYVLIDYIKLLDADKVTKVANF